MQGSLGLELAREHRPDLILLDLNLPDLPGDKVLLQLLPGPVLRARSDMMVSGDAIPLQVQRMLDLGAQEYITKLFNIRELLRKIDELLPLNGVVRAHSRGCGSPEVRPFPFRGPSHRMGNA